MFFPTSYIWHVSPKLSNWRGRINVFAFHGLLNIAHFMSHSFSELVPLQKTGPLVHSPGTVTPLNGIGAPVPTSVAHRDG